MSESNVRPTIGITADFDRSLAGRLEQLADIKYGGWGVTDTVSSGSELTDFLAGVDILVVAWEVIDAEVLSKSDLKYIASVRGGPGANIDLGAAAERGIPVTGTHGREAIPVAEFTFGLMIGLLRHIGHTFCELRDRTLASFDPPPPGDIGWGMEPNDPWNKYRGEDLYAKRLGLVGLGTVGRLVAERALAFGMTVVYYDPYAAAMPGITAVEIDELMSTCDIVSVHARYSSETHHLLGAEQVRLMKPNAILVNTARPHIVDNDALLEALERGSIAGAALDVHPKEPVDPDYRLLDMPNVLCTPHIAGSSRGVTYIQSLQVVENIERFLRGERLQTVVNNVDPAADGEQGA